MVKTSEIIDPFFSHDFYPQKSKKIVRLIDDMGYEGYGLYWRIVEFMHCNELCVGEERLIAGKEYTEKVKQVLNDFGLFLIDEDDRYFSERILRNIQKQEEKRKQSKVAATKKWSLANLKKYYVDIFGVEPTLTQSEIKTYYTVSDKISDFKSKLPDILYTAKCLTFDNLPNFKPSINWLLENDGVNIGKLLNGHFGKLRSWNNHLEFIKQQEREKIRGLEDDRQTAEREQTIEEFAKIGSKESAIEYIVKNNPDIRFINPEYGVLIERYKIKKRDLDEYSKKKSDTAV